MTFVKPRVLHLLDSYNSGGSERQAVQLARLLHETGRYDVYIAVLHDEGVLRDEVERIGLPGIVSFPLTSLFNRNAVIQTRRFADYLRRERIDILQSHDFYTNIFGSSASRLARVPLRIAARRESAVRVSKERMAERIAYRAYHKVVANCEEVRRQLIEVEGLAPEKVVTVYNGLDLSRFTPRQGLNREEVLASYGLPIDPSAQFVTIVANLRLEVKDHRTFLKAARGVAEKVLKANFVLAGEGPLIEQFRAMAHELGIGPQTHFLGAVSSVADLLAVSNVCVLSSRAEGFSNAILEYMAASRPVVATRVGGAAEAISEGVTGFTVEAGNDPALAEKLVTLLEQPGLADEMGRAGRERAEKLFSTAAQLERTENLYKQSVRVRIPVKVTATSDRPKARVLLVGPSLGILGGQAVQAARLLKHLNDDDDVAADFLPVNPTLPGVFGWLQRFKFVRTLVTSIAYIFSLLLKVPRYDVLHIFSASYLSFVLAPTPAILIARLYKKKTILNYRSGEADDHLTRWRRSAIRTIRLVDEIVVPSGYLVDVFARHGLKARYIHNIVDLEKFKFRLREPLEPSFFANRNFEPLYNVACILRAFAMVQHKFPDARLILAGDGSQRSSLEQLSNELKLRNVEFMGRISPDRMAENYDRADIYLNSPNIDNMPGSILEAFASGTPVVTTNAGGIPYIVNDGVTGLLAPCDQPEPFAAAIEKLLTNETLAREIALAAFRETKKYRWEAVRDEWFQLYSGLHKEQNSQLLRVDVEEDDKLPESRKSVIQ